MYCNYKQRETQTLTSLIGSLVQQFVQCQSTIPSEVRSLYSEHSEKGTKPSEKELLKILIPVTNKFSHVYIIVDALDECDPKTREGFIEILKQLPANFRLLCTSRHVGDIQEAFDGYPHLEIQASDADIRRYLEAQILKSPKLVKLCKKAADLRDTIIEKLIAKAKGMYVFLHV